MSLAISTRELALSVMEDGRNRWGVGVRRVPGLERLQEICWADKV